MSRPAVCMLTAAALLAAATWRLSAMPATSAVSLRDLEAVATPSSMPPVRVRLSKPAAQISLEIDGPYRVMARGDWRVLAQGQRLEATTVRVTEDSLQLGTRSFTAREVDIHVLAPGSLLVAGCRYPGHLRLVRDGQRQVMAVNVVELEQYVAAVVDAEMPSSFPAEARAAQAVAARSFVLCQMKTVGAANEFDVEDGVGSQVYRGLGTGAAAEKTRSASNPSSQEIAARTRGIVLTYQGRVFSTHYCSTCGGATVEGRSVFAAAAPPLVSVPCDFCREAPRYRWEVALPRDALARRAAEWCAARARPLGMLERIEVLHAAEGAVGTVRLIGSEGTSDLSSHEFRQQIAGVDLLPSADFVFELDGDVWIARGRGHGHRVGMCQWGARQQARLGRSCQEILAHYYPGTELTTVR